MKKYFFAAAVICAVFMASVCLSACSLKTSSNNDTSSSAQQKAASETKTDQSIVGSWATELYGDEYVYTFNADGTGVYNAAGKIMNLTYTTENGFYYETFEGNTTAVKHPYRVEGNKFIIKDTYGEEIVYTKK